MAIVPSNDTALFTMQTREFPISSYEVTTQPRNIIDIEGPDWSEGSWRKHHFWILVEVLLRCHRVASDSSVSSRQPDSHQLFRNKQRTITCLFNVLTTCQFPQICDSPTHGFKGYQGSCRLSRSNYARPAIWPSKEACLRAGRSGGSFFATDNSSISGKKMSCVWSLAS